MHIKRCFRELIIKALQWSSPSRSWSCAKTKRFLGVVVVIIQRVFSAIVDTL